MSSKRLFIIASLMVLSFNALAMNTFDPTQSPVKQRLKLELWYKGLDAKKQNHHIKSEELIDELEKLKAEGKEDMKKRGSTRYFSSRIAIPVLLGESLFKTPQGGLSLVNFPSHTTRLNLLIT